MTRKNSFPLLLFLCIIQSCSNTDCGNLPESYLNYEVAIESIRNANFKYEESIKTSKSSWIINATYYSCKDNVGFLILETKNKKYLYSDVPIQIWNEFKNADSFGKYYNSNIKGRYIFNLNK